MDDRQRANRLFSFDRDKAKGIEGLLAGVDEAGRGPLAGPVVAAAVILFKKIGLQCLNDSKQVTPQRREMLYRQIIRNSLFGVGIVDQEQIDAVNIYQATRLAMKKAILALPITPALLLIDGNMRVDLPLAQNAIVGGDAKSASIAAASILAKVYRDAWMVHLEEVYPGYEFKQHKGYATPLHLRKILEKGPSPVHRKSFFPIRVVAGESR